MSIASNKKSNTAVIFGLKYILTDIMKKKKQKRKNMFDGLSHFVGKKLVGNSIKRLNQIHDRAYKCTVAYNKQKLGITFNSKMNATEVFAMFPHNDSVE